MRPKVQKYLLRVAFALGGLLLLNASSARGDFVLTLSSTSSVAGGTQYNYNVFLAPGSELDAAGGGDPVANPANFLTLYAIPGLVNGSESLSTTLAALFSVAEHTAGLTPPTQDPHDVPGLTNITLNYTANMEISNDLTNPDLLLGTLSFTSTLPPGSGNLFYSGATQKHTPGAGGDENLANNTALVDGPTVGTAAVPEPASLVLLISCVPIGLLFLARRLIAGRAD